MPQKKLRKSQQNKQILGRKSYFMGHFLEKITAFYLHLKGYKILQKNFKCHLGEIDIIARKKRILLAIEVKSRAKIEFVKIDKEKFLKEEILFETQKRRIENALMFYLRQNQHYFRNYQIRFDLVVFDKSQLNLLGILRFKCIHHFKNFWS